MEGGVVLMPSPPGVGGIILTPALSAYHGFTLQPSNGSTPRKEDRSHVCIPFNMHTAVVPRRASKRCNRRTGSVVRQVAPCFVLKERVPEIAPDVRRQCYDYSVSSGATTPLYEQFTMRLRNKKYYHPSTLVPTATR